MNTAALNYRALPLSNRIALAEHRADPASAIPWKRIRADLFKGQP